MVQLWNLKPSVFFNLVSFFLVAAHVKDSFKLSVD